MKSERLATGADSWAALTVFVVLALVSAGLASRGGAVRRTGLALGALGVLGAVVALARQAAAGVFARFEPPVTPLDPFKPALLHLTLLVGVALAGGLLLAWRKSGPAARLASGNTPTRYGSVSRWLHWVTAGLFIALIPLGIFMSALPDEAVIREPLYIVHKSLGMTVLGLAIIRIIWGLISRTPPLSGDLGRVNRFAAKTAHVVLYGLMLAFPITGYLVSSLFGKVVPFYFLDIPNLVGVNKAAALPFGGLHKLLLPVLFYLVIAAHVLGALKHRYLDKQRDALERMTG